MLWKALVQSGARIDESNVADVEESRLEKSAPENLSVRVGGGGGGGEPAVPSKRYAAFISHHSMAARGSKLSSASSALRGTPLPLSSPLTHCSTWVLIACSERDAAMEARFLKDKLEAMSDGREVFLDSDQLSDLRMLIDHVKASEVLVLVQTAEVLLRPWCILEIHAAVTAQIPIVAVSMRGKGYDFAEATHLLNFLDAELDRLNPGAGAILEQNGVTPLDAAYLLSNCVPYLISIEFDASASSAIIHATLQDMMAEMERQRTGAAMQITLSRAEWFEKRFALPSPTRAVAAAATTSGREEGGAARLPPEVPVLPKGYIVREAVLSGIKAKLLDLNGESDRDTTDDAEANETGVKCKRERQQSRYRSQIVTAQGMGGAGKTVVASALCHDLELRNTYQRVCFVGVGQTPTMNHLQAQLYKQITHSALDASLVNDEDLIFSALQEATTGMKILLVVDDAWDLSHVRQLACLDPSTGSALVVTTRIQGLVPGCEQFSLGVLDPDTAVAMLLEVAGALAVPPYGPLLYQAVEACGRLPLTVAVAGSMLEQFGGRATEEFVRLLTEDRGEALREGEYGDEHVKVEDRIITGSLDLYVTADQLPTAFSHRCSKDLSHSILASEPRTRSHLQVPRRREGAGTCALPGDGHLPRGRAHPHLSLLGACRLILRRHRQAAAAASALVAHRAHPSLARHWLARRRRVHARHRARLRNIAL